MEKVRDKSRSEWKKRDEELAVRKTGLPWTTLPSQQHEQLKKMEESEKIEPAVEGRKDGQTPSQIQVGEPERFTVQIQNHEERGGPLHQNRF